MPKRKSRVEYVGDGEGAQQPVVEPGWKAPKVEYIKGYVTPRNEDQWNARLEVAKQWKKTSGRFPKQNKKNKEETNLYKWLKNSKPGGHSWTKDRWEKLNEAFGEGWEKDCFPQQGLAVWGACIRGVNRNEAQWDKNLEEVKQFKLANGRFPRQRGHGVTEARLYHWLYNSADTSAGMWTRERHNKLIVAFGDRWESDCFPNSYYFMS